MLIFEDISGKTERNGFYPAVIIEVEQECRPRVRNKKNCVGFIRRVFEYKKPAVRTDIL
jgi:hypothetical protein